MIADYINMAKCKWKKRGCWSGTWVHDWVGFDLGILKIMRNRIFTSVSNIAKYYVNILLTVFEYF